MADSFFSGTLPVPPGINQSYKKVHIKLKSGKEYDTFGDTKEAKAFKMAAAKQLQAAVVDWRVVEHIQANGKKHHHIPLTMTIYFYFEYMWMRDIDGGEKAVIDACFKHLSLNDNLVTEKHTFKNIDKINPRVEVSLYIAQE